MADRPPMASILSASAVTRMDELARRILELTGMRIADDESLRIMADAGFVVSFEEQRVRYPAERVAEFLAYVPRSFTIGGREPNDDRSLGDGSCLVRPQSGCPNVIDLETGKIRPALMADVTAMGKLNDMLANIPVAASLIYPDDVPPENRDVALLGTLLQVTRKHVFIQPFEPESTRRMIEMACVVRRSSEGIPARPPFSLILAPTSPLTLAPNEAKILRLAAPHRIPLFFGSTPQRGATGPVTLAGQAVLQHAENIGCIILAQVVQAGAPVIYGIRPASLDMKTGNSVWAGPEWALGTGAALQLANLYGFVTDVVGLPSDSKALDEQAGLEKGFGAAFTGLLGADMVAGAGFVETIMSGSFEQLVIDDDLAGMMLRVRRGIEVDEDRMAADLITAIGPGGNFLIEPHTLRYMRSETYYPEILNRQNRAAWVSAGANDVVQCARQRALELITNHHTPPLGAEAIRELNRLAFNE